MSEKKSQSSSSSAPVGTSVVAQVAERIKNSDNVLVALSKNPSVDELSAALGLTFMLDKLGKHATAIFSGAVPNAIEFLEPEKTFESNTNSLRDFIIALDKEKADHLRYKIEGDYVKVFITPYKTTLSEKDLEFSHGDFNVDLVIALNVQNESDLDSALSEYGKIKHDASSINISTSAPGKFGDLEWGDPGASSVSEMIADLGDIISDGEKDFIEKSTATALLAGIVAATNRFSNERTTADTMSIAASLMSAGADQQLISSSIPVDILTRDVMDANDEFDAVAKEESGEKENADREKEAKKADKPIKEPKEEKTEDIIDLRKDDREDEPEIAISRDDIEKLAKASSDIEEADDVAKKPEVVPDLPSPEPSPIIPVDATPINQENAPIAERENIAAPAEQTVNDLPPTPELQPLGEPASAMSGKVLTPPSKSEMPAPTAPVNYAAEMEQELRGSQTPQPTAPVMPTVAPSVAELPTAEAAAMPDLTPVTPENAIPVIPEPVVNNATSTSIAPPAYDTSISNIDPAQPPVMPMVASPDVNYAAPPAPAGVNQGAIEYATPPMPDGDAILPPPPAPISIDSMMPPGTIPDTPAMQEAMQNLAPVEQQPVMPSPVAQPSVGQVPAAYDSAQPQMDTMAPVAPIQPAILQEEDAPTLAPNISGTNQVMQDQVYADPSAFRIPGM